MMRYALPLLGIAMLMCAALAANADGPRWKPPDGRFPVLGWGIPSAENFQAYADAGFTVLWSVRAEDLQAADAAGLNSLVSGMPRTDEEAAQQFVRGTMDRPGVLGYAMRDEPGIDDLEPLIRAREWAEEFWPGGLYQINLFPNYASAEQMDVPTYREYVEQYMQQYEPKVLSYDHYALVNEDDLRPQYYENLEIIRAAALKYDVPFWAFALTSPHWSYRDPSEAEIRFQVFSDLVYGAQGIWYFCYKQPGSDVFLGGIVDREERPTHHYPQVTRMNAILSAWGPTLLDLRSVGVYHVGELPQGTQGLPGDGLVRSVTPMDPMIVGEFEHLDGGSYVMLMNRDWHDVGEWRVAFAGDVTALREVSREDGSLEEPLPVGADGVRLRIMAGGARLFRVER